MNDLIKTTIEEAGDGHHFPHAQGDQAGAFNLNTKCDMVVVHFGPDGSFCRMADRIAARLGKSSSSQKKRVRRNDSASPAPLTFQQTSSSISDPWSHDERYLFTI